MILTPVLSITATLGTVQDFGLTAHGHRRFVPIVGGEFSGDFPEGSSFGGKILAGGGDWQVLRPDGVTEVEARYTLQTHDGTLILITNRGYRHGPPEVMRRLAAGENVPPDAYYFRTVPVFEVISGKYDWLMRTVFVASGERHATEVVIQVWAVG
ncbi:MAG: DUF3237 domain-containing protein [Runella sp.]